MFGPRDFCTLPCAARTPPILRRAATIVASVVTTAIAAGCGGGAASGGSGVGGSRAAQRLLVQTFSGRHTIRSGRLTLEVRIVPSGSSTITRPLGLSFSGPFSSAGAGKPPASNFTITVFAQGRRGVLQLISAGGRGYITVSGQSYRLPATSFRNLDSGFGSLATTGGGANAGSGTLSKLGIRPLDWLTDPRIVGARTVGGARTTLVRARVDATRLLRDISAILGRAGSRAVAGSGAALPQSISAATQRSIARAIGRPTFDVWTGADDHVVRRLTLTATIPVTGHTRTLLGGMSRAKLTLDFEYADLNRPQTIVAPQRLAPYSVFRSKVDTVLTEIEGGLANATSGAGGGSPTSSAADQRYTRCITAAHGDVAKMQKCASLLGG